jgi:hypothetical protein
VQTLACDGVTRSSWAAAPQRAWFGAGDLVNLYAVASVALLLCFRQSLNSRTDVRCTQWDRAFLAATVDTRANVLDYPPAAKSVALERFGGSYTYCDVLLFESVFLTIAKVMHSLGQVDTHDSYEALCLLMAQSFWATIVDDICSHFFSADSFPMLEAGGGSTRRKQLFNRAVVGKFSRTLLAGALAKLNKTGVRALAKATNATATTTQTIPSVAKGTKKTK